MSSPVTVICLSFDYQQSKAFQLIHRKKIYLFINSQLKTQHDSRRSEDIASIVVSIHP